MDATTFLHPDDINPQKVVAASDFPNHIGSSMIVELPFGKGRLVNIHNPVANYVFGGWQLSGIWQYQSGVALGFGDPIFTGNLQSVLQAPYGNRQVNEMFNVNGPGFNTITSQQKADDYVTISPRFSWFRAPAQDQFDASLLKNTRVKEKYNLQVKLDALNVFNHAWLAAPVTTVTSATFGQTTSEDSWPRRLQITFKFLF